MMHSVEPVLRWGNLVKFSHTIFALPFALSMAVVVTYRHSVSGTQIVAVLFAMIGARTAAMGFNRLVDCEIDAKNPRTMKRELPSGRVSRIEACALVILSSLVFLIAASCLGAHCLVVAPAVLGILFLYSYTKQCTSFSHLVLGLCLACAPGGVWYALVGTTPLLPILMMGAVLFWVAGFDVIYSCQDVDFDRREKLFSIPSWLGIRRSLTLAKIAHVTSILLLVLFGIEADFGIIYFLTVLLFALCVASQHSIISSSNLDRVNEAFFVRNGLASVLFFVGVVVERVSA